MKKIMTAPSVQIVKLQYSDIVTTSALSVGEERISGTYDDAAVQTRHSIWGE